MKGIRWWALGASLLVGLAVLQGPTGQDVRNAITPKVLQSGAWVFTALQTFTGGVKTPLLVKKDWTLANPSVAPTGVDSGSGTAFVKCLSSDSFKVYTYWFSPSGQTFVSPPSGLITTTGDHTINVTLQDTPPAGATAWGVADSKNSEGHNTIRNCGGTIALTTPTALCNCQATTVLTTNTTSAKTVIQGDEIKWKFSRYGVSPQQLITEGPNVIEFSGTQPMTSNDSGANYSRLAAYGKNIRYACAVGCEYSTVGAALAAITDASSSNQYLILMGHLSEGLGTVTLKSWVSLEGLDPFVSKFTDDVSIPLDGTGIRISNVSMLGNTPLKWSSGTPTIRSTVEVINCILGTPTSIDGIFDQVGSHDIVVRDSTIYSRFDSLVFGPGTHYWEFNMHYVLDDTGIAQSDWGGLRWQGLTDLEFHQYNADYQVTMSNAASNFRAMDIFETSGSPSTGSFIEIFGASVRVNVTASSGTPTATCLRLGATKTSAVPNRVRIYDLDCVLKAGSVGTLTALDVYTADADHASWDIAWQGGSMVETGGATRTDVNNVETVGGFSLSLSGVEHAGVYTGAGTVTAIDTRKGAFTTQLRGRVGDLVAATCTNNEIALDTGGANNEICICNGGAWACSTVTTVTGPTN